MATTKIYGTLKLTSTAGKSQSIELPQLNDTIRGNNTTLARSMFDSQVASIAAAYEDDDGFGLMSAELTAHTLISGDALGSTIESA